MAFYTVNELTDYSDRFVVEELHGDRIRMFTNSRKKARFAAVFATICTAFQRAK